MQSVPRPMGHRGVFQGDKADASAGGLYGHGLKRHKVADMDGASGISPASSDRLARRLETEFPQAFHFDKGDDLEPQKPGAAD